MTMPQGVASVSMIGKVEYQESRDHKTIAYGGGLLLVASAFGNGLNYFFGMFLARTLGPEDFGLYALALTVFNILTLAVVFGVDKGAIRFISQHLVESQLYKARANLITATLIAFSSGLVSAIGLMAMAPLLAVAVLGKPELTADLMLFAAAIPFSTATIVMLSGLQAFQSVRYTVFIKYIWEPVVKFVLAAVLIWAGFQLTGVLISIILTFVGGAAIAIRATYRLTSEVSDKFVVWDKYEVRKLLVYCFPLAVSNLFGVLAPRADILILGYWSNTQDVGIYLAAFQTAAIMALVLSAFDVGLAPILSRACSLHDCKRMGESYQAVASLSITVSLPIFCCLLLFADEVLSMFGPNFMKGTTALTLLACGQLFNNLTGSANTVLLMSGHSRIVMTNTIIMGVVLLLFTVTTIPLWGINGAAIAASTTFIITNMIRVLQVWRLQQVLPYTWGLLKPIAAAASAGGIVFMLRGSSLLLPTPILGVFMVILYLTVLWLLGISRQDRILLESLRLKGKSLFERG